MRLVIKGHYCISRAVFNAAYKQERLISEETRYIICSRPQESIKEIDPLSLRRPLFTLHVIVFCTPSQGCRQGVKGYSTAILPKMFGFHRYARNVMLTTKFGLHINAT